LKKKYILKGIVCKFKAKSIMLIKNEYNSYWYSVTEQLWVDCVDLYVKQSEDVVKVYYLFENTTKYNLKFDNLQIYSSNKIKSHKQKNKYINTIHTHSNIQKGNH
jgi:hypothetical protein